MSSSVLHLDALEVDAPDAIPAPPIDAHPDPLAIASRLAETLAASAVERDRAGGHPAHERELMRASGLLTLSIPARHGGQGASCLPTGANRAAPTSCSPPSCCWPCSAN